MIKIKKKNYFVNMDMGGEYLLLDAQMIVK